jgi:alpha-ribazole phosphatase
MNLFLLRHGETEDNASGLFSSASDAPLNDCGRQQLRRVAARLLGIAFDRVISSPSARSVESAAIALPDYAVEMDERLQERDMGIFDGLIYGEIASRYPEECRLWGEDWVNFSIPQGESYAAFYDRVAGFLRELLAGEDGNVLLCTHGGVVRASCCYVMGDRELFWKFSCRNADLTQLKYEHGNLFLGYIQPDSLN